MDLYNAIIVTIWLTMLYAVWAATAAGDPGYGQAAFIISGIAGHLYLRKLKLERPVRSEEEIEIPNAEFSVEILEEKDKYVSNKSDLSSDNDSLQKEIVKDLNINEDTNEYSENDRKKLIKNDINLSKPIKTYRKQ